MNYGRSTLPNGREITDYMDRLYGKCNKGKWYNVVIIYLDEEEAEEEVGAELEENASDKNSRNNDQENSDDEGIE